MDSTSFLSISSLCRLSYTKQSRVAQPVERTTPGEEIMVLIPFVAAHSLLVGLVSVYCDRLRQKSWSPCFVSCVAACKIVRCQS